MNSDTNFINFENLHYVIEGTSELPKVFNINKKNLKDKQVQSIARTNSQILSTLVLKEMSIFNSLVELETTQENEIVPDEPDKNSNIHQFKRYGSYVFQKEKKKSQFSNNKPIYQLNKGPYYYHTTLIQTLSIAENKHNEIQRIFHLHFSQTLAQVQQKMAFTKNQFNEQKRITLSNQITPKKTLVLDLDETLIHCNEALNQKADFFITICIQFGLTIRAGVRVRPYMHEFLEQMSKIYELIIFTASQRIYAEAVLNKIDPDSKFISQIFSRESCIQDKGCFVKDLRIFKGRDLSQVIIVDNQTMSFIYQLENGIPIIPFYNNDHDDELQHLAQFLKYLNNSSDVRSEITKYFQLETLSRFDNMYEACRQLYSEFI